VADQNEVAVTFEFVAGVGDDTVIGSLDRSAFRYCQIDTVVLRPIRLAAESSNDPTAHGPTERRHGFRSLDRRFSHPRLFLGHARSLNRPDACDFHRCTNLLNRHRARLCILRRRDTCHGGRMAARNSQPITDAELRGCLQMVGARER